MPSKSFAQARMMAGAAHDPVFAKKVGVPTKVAKEFNKADDKSGFLGSAMRAKGPAYKEGGNVKKTRYADGGEVEKMMGPLGGIPRMIREVKKKFSGKDEVPSRMAPGRYAADILRGEDELRGMPDPGRKSSDDRQKSFLERLDRETAEGASRRAQEAKDREAARAKAPPARSDRDNPDRGTITRGFSKGGGVKGKGAEKRGTRPAKYY